MAQQEWNRARRNPPSVAEAACRPQPKAAEAAGSGATAWRQRMVRVHAVNLDANYKILEFKSKRFLRVSFIIPRLRGPQLEETDDNASARNLQETENSVIQVTISRFNNDFGRVILNGVTYQNKNVYNLYVNPADLDGYNWLSEPQSYYTAENGTLRVWLRLVD